MKPALKLGIQCQEKDLEAYRYNRELRPVVVKSINIVDREHYIRLAADNPGVELVYRQVPNGPWDAPEEDGKRWAEHLYAQIGHIPEITLVEDHNEWVHSPPHNSPEDFDRADRFMFAFISWVHELWGGRVHAVVLNASCGHFSEDIIDFFPRTLQKLQECGRCLLALHEYDHPSRDMLGDGSNYLCGKFLRNLAGLRQAGYDKVRIALTECGVDSGVGAPAGSGHVGFKYWGESAATRYLDNRNLGWYIPLLQNSEGVAWATIFICGGHGDWATFDIKNTEVIHGIGEIYSNWVPVEPPEPPTNGDEEMEIEVIDMHQQPQTLEWAQKKYGVQFRRADAQPGENVFRIIKLLEKTGHHSWVSRLLDHGGLPMEGEAITFYWSDAPDPPDPPIEVYPHDWYKRFTWGRTSANGDVGPGMGTGAYHGEGEGGPHAAWVHHPTVKSDLADKFGMLAGTFHDHLDVVFQLMVVPKDEEPPVKPPANGDLISAVNRVSTELAKIRVIMEGVFNR